MKIAIASGKGGTGKTTLAVNLAHYFAEREAVALADLDVEEPNSGIFIQGELLHRDTLYTQVPQWQPELCTRCGKCPAWCRFNAVLKLGDQILVLPQLCHSCFACSELCPSSALPMQPRELGEVKHYRSGVLDFIEGRLKIGNEQASPLIHQTLNYLAESLPDPRHRFYDCPPGTSCAVIAATREADLVLLVTEPTPFGLYDLELAVQTMRHLGRETAVVVNRCGIGNAEVFAFCAREHIPVWAQIPDQRSIAERYSRGELLHTSVPEFRRELEKIARQIRARAGS